MWSVVSKVAERSNKVTAVTDPLTLIEKKIVLNIKEGTFSRVMFGK